MFNNPLSSYKFRLSNLQTNLFLQIYNLNVKHAGKYTLSVKVVAAISNTLRSRRLEPLDNAPHKNLSALSGANRLGLSSVFRNSRILKKPESGQIEMANLSYEE